MFYKTVKVVFRRTLALEEINGVDGIGVADIPFDS